jgi:hypothetical protein
VAPTRSGQVNGQSGEYQVGIRRAAFEGELATTRSRPGKKGIGVARSRNRHKTTHSSQKVAFKAVSHSE